MSTIVLDTQSVHIPPWVKSLRSFRRWAFSNEFPESGRISYLKNEVWVDMSREQFFHNQVKGEITSRLFRLVQDEGLGKFFPDGYLLTNEQANLSTNPDGMFAKLDAFTEGRVRLVEGAEEGYVELQGAPEMVLEIVSPGSRQKDCVTLRELYWLAGVEEYWLVEQVGRQIGFTILRRAARDYVPVRTMRGWTRSRVFAHDFRLVQTTDRLGYTAYALRVR